MQGYGDAGPAAMAVPAGRMVPTSAAPPSSEDQVVPFSPPLSEDSRPPSNTNQGQPSPGRPPLPPSNLNTAPPSTEQNGQAPHRLYASPFQAVSMDRRASWDVRDDLPTGGAGQGRHRHRPVDALGNLQAPGANRQFSLELTTYASIPVRSERSGFRPPHRYVLPSRCQLRYRLPESNDAVWLGIGYQCQHACQS